jgi:hypothetical protein
MKTYLVSAGIFTLSLLMAACGGSGTSGVAKNETVKSDDWTKDRLTGKVKSVRQRVYWALEKFGRIEKGKLQSRRNQDYLREYNSDGFLTEETFFDAQDSVTSRRTITYDNSGLLLKEELYERNGKLSSSVLYTYADGKLQQKEMLDAAGKLKERYAYTYYDTGWLMDEDKYNAGNQLSHKVVHVYDVHKYDGGKTAVEEPYLTEKQYYWGGGTPYKKEFMEYYAKEGPGRSDLVTLTTMRYEKKEAIFDGSESYSDYNRWGDFLHREVVNKQQEKVEIHEYTYDAFGNLTGYSVSKYVPNKAVEVAVAEEEGAEVSVENVEVAETEDAANKVQEVEGGNSDEWVPGVGALYEYAYDETNNWTRKITYEVKPGVEAARQFYYERVVIYY